MTLRKILIYLTLISGISACTGTSEEVININGMDINRSLINEITAETGSIYELYIDTKWIQDPAHPKGYRIDTVKNGVVFRKINETKAGRLQEEYQKILKPREKYLFMSEASFNISGNLCYDLVIVEANNQFQAVRLVRPTGLAEGISHDTIFDLLVKLHQVNPVDIYLLDKSNIGLKLRDPLSAEWEQEIAALCPSYELYDRDLKLLWRR